MRNRPKKSNAAEAMIRRQANVQVKAPMRTIKKLHGPSCESFRETLLTRARNFLRQHPVCAATRQQVAIHEAGHLVSFELEGMVAARAKVDGKSVGDNGWCGVANCWDPPVVNPKTDAHDLLREARAALAGPIAEELLSGGDVCASLGELIDARVLTDRAGRQLGCDPDQLLHEVLVSVAASIEINAVPLHRIANRLTRRRTIWREHFERDLAGLKQLPERVEISDQAEAVVHRIEWVLGCSPPRSITSRNGKIGK